MNGSWKLSVEDIAIRPIQEEDAEFSFRLVKPKDAGYFGTMVRPGTIEEESEWIQEERDDDSKFSFVVELLKEEDKGKRIGLCGLSDVNLEIGKAEIWMILGQEYRSQGYGTEAARLLVQYGFEGRSLDKINARIFELNTASEKLTRDKLGFKKEGERAYEFKHAGELYTGLLYGLTRDRWKELGDIYGDYKIVENIPIWE